MLDPIIKFIEIVKDLGFRKILGLFALVMIFLIVYKAEVIIPFVNEHFKDPPKQEQGKKLVVPLVITENDLDISKENMAKITSYFDKYVNPIVDKIVLASIYKYMPEGPEFQYQGRILVYSKIPLNQSRELIKELGISWVPLWSGRFVNSSMFDKLPTIAKYDTKTQLFRIDKPDEYKDNLHKLPSVNIPILLELGIRYIYYYPIINRGKTIGYIAFYLQDLDKTIEENLEVVSKNLASRISLYLVED